MCTPAVLRFGGCSLLLIRTKSDRADRLIYLSLAIKRLGRHFFSPAQSQGHTAPAAAQHLSSPSVLLCVSLTARPSVLLSRAIRRRSMHHLRHLLVLGGGGGDEWNGVEWGVALSLSLSLSVSHTQATPTHHHHHHQLLAMTANCFPCTFSTSPKLELEVPSTSHTHCAS